MTTMSDSNVLKLEKLQESYSSILMQYKQAYANATAMLNNNKDKIFTVLKNKAYFGGNVLKNIPKSSINNCQAACSSNSLCSGATFYNVNNTCTLESGIGTLSEQSSQYTAIVPAIIQQVTLLNQLNGQLIQINDQIMELVNVIYPGYTTNIKNASLQKQKLLNNYNVLKQQRNSIQSLIHSYETLNEEDIDNVNSIHQNSTIYFILAITSILLVYLLVKITILE